MKIKVPEHIELAARRAFVAWQNNCRPDDDYTNGAAVVAEAVCRAIAENPIVPTDTQQREILTAMPKGLGSVQQTSFRYAEWQRRMFLELESEASEAVKDLVDFPPNYTREALEKIAIEAYRRGQRSKEGK